MTRISAILAVCGLCAGVTGVALALNIPTPSAGQVEAARRDQLAAKSLNDRLIVHEWGTFTGFAGSDGVHLPFGTAVGNDLPPFVLSRLEQAQRQDPKIQWIDFGKGGGVLALQRMETPVIYFYSDRPRDVSVAVDFPKGLLTEFYPPVRRMTPAFGDAPGEPGAFLDGKRLVSRPEGTVPKLERGSLDWGMLRIVPQSADGEAEHMPDVPSTPEAAAHYQYARETDAATVRFSDRSSELHEERFLFYRGLGDFALPVTVRAMGDDRFEMSNTGEQPVAFALLLQIADGRARFVVSREIEGARTMSLPARSAALHEVGDAIARALVAEGLYEKEARAMVKTWSSQWLGEPGTRVLYTVPRAATDALLPLRIAPAPDETVRVLVGRIDVMTPAQEAKVQSLLASSRQIKVLAAADAALLQEFGRFFEPALKRAAQLRAPAEPNAESGALRSLYYNAVRSPESPLLATQ